MEEQNLTNDIKNSVQTKKIQMGQNADCLTHILEKQVDPLQEENNEKKNTIRHIRSTISRTSMVQANMMLAHNK